MASSYVLSDNGVSSGVAGIKTGGGDDGKLLLQTTNGSGVATTAVTVDSSQNVVFAATVRMSPYTVATLPAAGTAGRRAYVSNALAPIALATVVGGGSVTVPVFDNGTNWIVG